MPCRLDLYVPKDAENQGIFTKTLFDLPNGKPSAFVTWWQNVETIETDVQNINFQSWLLPDGTILMGYDGLSDDASYLPATAAVVPGFEDQVRGQGGFLK